MPKTPRPASTAALRDALAARFPGVDLAVPTDAGQYPHAPGSTCLTWTDGPTWDELAAALAELGVNPRGSNLVTYRNLTGEALATVLLDQAAQPPRSVDPGVIARTLAATSRWDLSGAPGPAARLLAHTAGVSGLVPARQTRAACKAMLAVLATAGGLAAWAELATTVLTD